jgi:dUTP pyrophosphatase
MPEQIEIKLINKSGSPHPEYKTSHSAGMDLRSASEEEIVLKPGGRGLIPTGLYIQLPDGFEAQVRSRSGLALKQGVAVLNSPGTIDADYRGEVGVILINHGEADFVIRKGDRVAQMVIAPYVMARFKEVEELESTDRGAGGFGSTGHH